MRTYVDEILAVELAARCVLYRYVVKPAKLISIHSSSNLSAIVESSKFMMSAEGKCLSFSA